MSYRWLGRSLLAAALCLLAGTTLCAQAAPWQRRSAADRPTDRIIVKWRDQGVAAMQIQGSANRAARLSASTGVHVTAMREIHDRLDLMRLDSPVAGAHPIQVIPRLRAHPSVKKPQVDSLRYLLAFPPRPTHDPPFFPGS